METYLLLKTNAYVSHLVTDGAIQAVVGQNELQNVLSDVLQIPSRAALVFFLDVPKKGQNRKLKTLSSVAHSFLVVKWSI